MHLLLFILIYILFLINQPLALVNFVFNVFEINSGWSESNLQDKVLSSANRINLKNGLESERSFINNRKRIGPKIETCGSPDGIGRVL